MLRFVKVRLRKNTKTGLFGAGRVGRRRRCRSTRCTRRHESAEKIANRAEYFLKEFSQKSNRVVGKMAQVSYKTVERQRKKLEDAGEIPKHERREEASGRMQKVEKSTGTDVPVKAPDISDYLQPRPKLKPRRLAHVRQQNQSKTPSRSPGAVFWSSGVLKNP